MKSYLIGYDLNKQGKDYTGLIEKIKTLTDNWWHCLDSTWIIKTNMSAEQIRDSLSKVMDPDDELLVVLLQRDAAWKGFSTDCSIWLKDNL